MENTNQQFAHIKGWGIDADPKNDPTYPMKNRQIAIKRGYSWNRPEQQPINQEILHSIERPNVTAVFGTSAPPSGLSGAIRRFAFTQSENSYLHWLPLILADRVNEVEGIVEDLKAGHVPNIFAEKGWKAKWKHNPEGLILNVALSTAVATAFITYMVKSKKDSDLEYDDSVTAKAHALGTAAKNKGKRYVHSAHDHLSESPADHVAKNEVEALKDRANSEISKAENFTDKAIDTVEPLIPSKGWLSHLFAAIIPSVVK
ncbi:hypothetical protein [Anditalea andensis]|uniref:Uncharacterized protein n=1 Tax=Anditalea andensis TaxID=1048983 RepID=A0A074L5M5_9BACT|nr:hypothetical protein [Anditalea andensis]KEO75790.1 hypothetical protein EL17_22455 [Anditalea andensis]